MENLMSIPLVPELDTHEGEILLETVQLLNYVMVAPTLSRQELATKLLGVSAKFMETLSNQKATIQSLGKQLTDVNEQLENVKASVSSEPEPEDSVWSEPDADNSVWSEPDADNSVWSEPDAGGSVWSEPDAGGSVWSEPDAGGSVWSGPDAGGSVWSEPEAGGSVWSEPDAEGSVWSGPDAGGSVWSKPDAGGSVWSEPDAEGNEDRSSTEAQADALLERIKNSTETIWSSTSEYIVEEVLGSGSFGTVVQCVKKPSNETVAVKIIKDNMLNKSIEEAKAEVEVLNLLKALGSEQVNIVSSNDSFMYKGLLCIEFKKLDVSLKSYMRTWGPLQLKEIRAILQQITGALSFLKDKGIIHTDLKPENVMLVDRVQQPLKVQLIDFGEAMRNPEEWVGGTFQTLMYRSPETVLGVLCNYAIDIWSLACMAAEMLTGTLLFQPHDETELMERIVSVIGQPPNKVLKAGMYTDYYFNETSSSETTQGWVLKPPESISPKASSTECPPDPKMKLHHLLKVPASATEDEQAVECDHLCFIDLVKRMLHTDASERITAEEILSHPFITMSHLNHPNYNSYVKSSMECMKVCNNWSFDGGENVCVSRSPGQKEDKARSTTSDCTSATKEKTPLDSDTKFSTPKKENILSPSKYCGREGNVEDEDLKTSSIRHMEFRVCLFAEDTF